MSDPTSSTLAPTTLAVNTPVGAGTTTTDAESADADAVPASTSATSAYVPPSNTGMRRLGTDTTTAPPAGTDRRLPTEATNVPSSACRSSEA